jgi:PRC-barrel domain protein
MPERSGGQANSEGAMDRAADRLKEAAGSLTGDKKDQDRTDVRDEGRHDRFTELEEAYKGYAVYDQHYERLGKVDDLFVDEGDQPEYIGVKMGSLLEQKTVLIPMGIVRVNDRRKLVEVAADKDTIQEAPDFDSNKDITPEYEDRVHGYFGLEREGSVRERGGYSDYYASDFGSERYSDQALAGVDTEYGERADPQNRLGVSRGDRVHDHPERPPLGREETAEPRNDVAGAGEAARTGGTPLQGAGEQETASVRVHKRVR